MQRPRYPLRTSYPLCVVVIEKRGRPNRTEFRSHAKAIKNEPINHQVAKSSEESSSWTIFQPTRLQKRSSTRQCFWSRQKTWMLTFVDKVGGLYLRSVPRNKVHACKMHQIKCAGILGWKKVSQLISRHGPDFALFLFIFYMIFPVNSSDIFLGQAETRAAAQQNTFYEFLIKGPPQAQLFSV